jgi:hypothetical protein
MIIWPLKHVQNVIMELLFAIMHFIIMDTLCKKTLNV